MENTKYDMDTIADEHSAANYVSSEDNTAWELAASLYTASEMIGHSNKRLVESVSVAQQLVGDTTDINLRPFDVSADSMEDGTAYLQRISDRAKVCLGQAKAIKADDLDTYKKVSKLIDSVGTAEEYKGMVF